MEKIGSLMKFKPKVKEKKLYQWQDLALQIIKDFGLRMKGDKACVFRVCKQDMNAASHAYVDCMENNKLYVRYFYKIYSEIRKRYETT